MKQFVYLFHRPVFFQRELLCMSPHVVVLSCYLVNTCRYFDNFVVATFGKSIF